MNKWEIYNLNSNICDLQLQFFFNDSSWEFLGAFSRNLGYSNSLNVELIGAMYAVEIAFQKGWSFLWLQTDFMLVTFAYKSMKLFSGSSKHMGKNAPLFSTMIFMVTIAGPLSVEARLDN